MSIISIINNTTRTHSYIINIIVIITIVIFIVVITSSSKITLLFRILTITILTNNTNKPTWKGTIR